MSPLVVLGFAWHGVHFEILPDDQANVLAECEFRETLCTAERESANTLDKPKRCFVRKNADTQNNWIFFLKCLPITKKVPALWGQRVRRASLDHQSKLVT